MPEAKMKHTYKKKKKKKKQNKPKNNEDKFNVLQESCNLKSSISELF